MKYFGTDGIRGIPNEQLTISLATALGMALSELGEGPIYIGTDTRTSKDMLSCALIAGCLSNGLDVHFLGVISTPGLIYLSKLQQATGVMITASHNPAKYNGIKVVRNGNKLSPKQEEQLEYLIDHPSYSFQKTGKCFYSKHFLKEYHKHLLDHLNSSHFKIALDCANGSTYQTAPLIFNLVTSSLVLIGNHPDGTNINEECGATDIKQLSSVVTSQECDFGIAFDGDGDRIILVDRNGNCIDGDSILYILALYLKSVNKLKDNTVVLSVMSNLGVIQSLKRHGIRVIETPVGDKHIGKVLSENKYSLGGESSGHIILADMSTTGDGILVALKIISILEETHTRLEDWISDITYYPDSLQNLVVKDKKKVMGDPLRNEIELMKRELNQDCKILVRPSGTEDCIRVSVMARTKQLVQEYKERLISYIRLLDA